MFGNGEVMEWPVFYASLRGDPGVLVQSVGNLKEFIQLSFRPLVWAKYVVNKSFQNVGLW